MTNEQVIDVTPETRTVAPSEYKIALRLKHSRFIARLDGSQVAELQWRCDRVSKYLVRRLQRKYRALGVSRPRWSVDPGPTVRGIAKYAYCYFDYIDLTPYTDDTKLVILPEETYAVSMPQNRAARRAQR